MYESVFSGVLRAVVGFMWVERIFLVRKTGVYKLPIQSRVVFQIGNTWHHHKHPRCGDVLGSLFPEFQLACKHIHTNLSS